MLRRTMDWDKLRIFHAAAEAGSFTHAGDTLHMSQSAVSRQVSALERELHVPLFHRHARGLVLTEQGELLYRTAHEVFSKLLTAEMMLADTREKPTGNLRIAVTTGLGAIWLTPRIREFIDLYPDINIELKLSDDELDLSMREADVAIRLWEPTQSDLIRRPLFTVHFHAYAATQYIRRFGSPQDISELDKHRIVSYGGSIPIHLKEVNWLETAGRNGKGPRTPVMRVNGVVALKRAAVAGIGIVTLPDYLADDGSDIVPVLASAKLPEFQAYFVYTEELKNSKRVQVFRDFLVAKARQWKF
jgi:DNA-binding transcriptional LysR family regulator